MRADKRAGLTIKLAIVAILATIAVGVAEFILKDGGASDKPAPSQPTSTTQSSTP